MNRIKCGFCGEIRTVKTQSFMCSCGQKARAKYRECAICGKGEFVYSDRDICQLCANKGHKKVREYKCSNGHIFSAPEAHAVVCPDCGIATSKAMKQCEKCGSVFYGMRSTTHCEKCRCHTDGKKPKRAVSESEERANRLCAKVPAEVHQFIHAEIRCRPSLAEAIAERAKTAFEAKQMIADANSAYLRARSSCGVASYG